MIARTIKTPRTIAKIATEEMGALNGSIGRKKYGKYSKIKNSPCHSYL